jgi:hypothetical protein
MSTAGAIAVIAVSEATPSLTERWILVGITDTFDSMEGAVPVSDAVITGNPTQGSLQSN